ncbi:antitoxin [Streptacidiphilus sp. EB129]|jgi:hypothetical protein|uniref:antitoxin n=1 Tax=Streptacidiphilus sp. EB129 TaxID=3156262 RepID=UPI003513F3E1
MSVIDKVKGMLKGHESQAQQSVGKAGDMIDEKTGGKYADKVDMAEKQAEQQLGLDPQPPDAGQQP